MCFPLERTAARAGLVLLLCGFALARAYASEGKPAVLVLESFERRAIDLERGAWRSSTGGDLSDKHVTHGRRSLWNAFSRTGAVLWCVPGRLAADWSGYEKFKTDVFVEGPPLVLAVELTDEDGNRYLIPHYFLRSGSNTIEVDLAGVAHTLDITHIARLLFRCVRAPRGRNITYFDNLRLTRGEPGTIPAELAQVPPTTAVAGNLVKNPGFEYGLQNWQFWGHFDWGDYRLSLNRTGEAHSGTGCAAIKQVGFTPGRGGLATDRIWVPAPGRYRLTVFVKGTGGAVFRVGLAHARFVGTVEDVQTDSQWRELTYTVTVRNQRQPVRVWLYNVGMGTLYIDDVALVPETTTEQPGERIQAPPADVRLRGDLMYVNGKPFFPLGVVGGEDAEGGVPAEPFNLLVAPPTLGSPKPLLNRCYRAGLFAVANLSEAVRVHSPTAVKASAEAVRGHPALVGLLFAEEPDGEFHPVGPPEVRLARRCLREAVGNDLPAVIRLQGSTVSSFYQYRGLADVVMVSVRAVASRRPFDLGAVTRPIDQAKTAFGGRAPIWAVLNLGDEKTPEPKPEELSVMTYLAVTHGADGVLWEPFFYLQEHPAVSEALEGIAAELRRLTPALASPTVRVITGTNKPTMHGTARRHQDELYLIIVNASPQPQPGTTFTLKDVPASAAVEVLFEDRTLTLEGGVLTDDFGPYQRHVYRLRVPPKPPAAPADESGQAGEGGQ